jgi:DNA invertase Pin-like site-specific DNA recombinase
VREYADANRYRIVRWYIDDGISGDDTDKRHDFQRMITDAGEKKDFKAIVVWDQDRFGRFDSLEAGRWIDPLRRATVRLVTINEGMIDWDDMTGRLMYSIKQEAKHQFLKDLSRNVTRGQMEAAKAGSWLGSPPLAYRVVGPHKQKTLVLDDPDKVRLVQRIFREFVELRLALCEIARRLNTEGVPSPRGRGKSWRFDAVKVILSNQAYAGDMVSGKEVRAKYNAVKNGAVVKSDGKRYKRPPSEWTVHKDHHPAIIDRETFAKAQELLTRSVRPSSHGYSLAGLLRCGQCGSVLWGMKNCGITYYECSGKRTDDDVTSLGGATQIERCPGCTVREDKVLQVIADSLETQFLALDGRKLAWKASRKKLKPGDLPRAFAKVRQLIAPPKQIRIDRKRTEKEFAALTTKLEQARKNLVLLSPANIPAAEATIAQLEEQKALLTKELAQQLPTEEETNAVALETLRRLYWLAVLFRGLTEKDGPIRLEHPADPEDVEHEGPVLTGVGSEIRSYLRNVESITLHTQVTGEGRGRRHTLKHGEIRLEKLGVTTGSSNPPPRLEKPVS